MFKLDAHKITLLIKIFYNRFGFKLPNDIYNYKKICVVFFKGFKIGPKTY